MNIVHISGGNYGSIPFQYCDLINKHTTHNSRLVTIWGMPQNFPCDIVFNERKYSVYDIEKLIDSADIFHIHEPFMGWYNPGSLWPTVESSFYNGDDTRFWVNCELDKYIRKSISKTKKVVITHHGIPLREHHDAIRKFHESTKYVATVTTPDLKQFLPQAVWIPHPVDPDRYPNLKQKEGPVRVCHSTSAMPVHTTEQIVKLYNEYIPKKYPETKLVILKDISYIEVLMEKCQSHINIGRLGIYVNGRVYGLYNMGDLEAMVMGLPSMSRLDDSIRQILPDIPIVDISEENFVGKLSELIENKSLREDIGKQSRKWVLENHSPKLTVKNLLEVYEAL